MSEVVLDRRRLRGNDDEWGSESGLYNANTCDVCRYAGGIGTIVHPQLAASKVFTKTAIPGTLNDRRQHNNQAGQEESKPNALPIACRRLPARRLR